jgi:hypothetical protein
VQLPDSHDSHPSASAFLNTVLHAIVRKFPQVFDDVPSASPPPVFPRRRLARMIETMEPSRGASIDRLAIAKFATALIQQSVVFRSPGKILPLDAAFRESSDPLRLIEFAMSHPTNTGNESTGRFLNRALLVETGRLAESSRITPEAAKAIGWTLDAIREHVLDLSGEKFVLLGGTAELSPLGILLSLGADVLTTHASMSSLTTRLASDIGESAECSGRLFVVDGGVDLLSTPVELSRSICEFARGSRVHLGVLAYKGGEAREWRLAAVMDGIARAIRDVGLLKSIFYYLTPSMTTEISRETAAVAQSRLRTERSVWTEFVRTASIDVLFRPNIVRSGETFWTRSVLPDQGASYMGANLFGKIYAAEVFGDEMSSVGRGYIQVSANVAPVTGTGSTATSQTTLLFPELAPLGIEVFDPQLTQRLMACLLLHDLFCTERPPRRAFAQQVHGGVFTSPWALDSSMKLAYLRGRYRRGVSMFTIRDGV